MPPATDYDHAGRGYALQRRPDPRIAARLLAQLGAARTVLNVGAGTGSYEPADRRVIAVEPSRLMIAQRPPAAAPVLRARAERLPFPDRSFEAVMAILTIHHWADWRAGLAECARVARRVILLTWDPDGPSFWLLQDYFPQFVARDRGQFPSLSSYPAEFGPSARVTISPVPVPRDCTDGFLGAYWARPAAYLDPEVRGAMSPFAHPGAEPGLQRLRADLASGTWAARHGRLRDQAELDIGYRLVVADLAGG